MNILLNDNKTNIELGDLLQCEDEEKITYALIVKDEQGYRLLNLEDSTLSAFSWGHIDDLVQHANKFITRIIKKNDLVLTE